MGAESTIVIAARDEEERIGGTVAALRRQFPGAEILVVAGACRDATAERAEEAGAVVIRLARSGKGEALSVGERAAARGPLLLCDADLRGELEQLTERGADLAIAAFSRRVGGGLGFAEWVARALIRLHTGYIAREPLSGQRYVSERARAACFPSAPGFGCELRMTVDALHAGLRVEEIELELEHRTTGRDVAGFSHRGRQVLDSLLAAGPLAVNHRGARLPLVGWMVALPGLGGPRGTGLAVAAVASLGLADDVWSGPERGVAAHLGTGRTTGILKLVGIPLIGLAATRSLAGALAVGLSANALNQLDTKPGRALKTFGLCAILSGGATAGRYGVNVLLLPYDLRERVMLGDAGSNALGAVVGCGLVATLRGRALWPAIGALAAFNLLGERRSLGEIIEKTPWLTRLDGIGRLR